MNEEKSKKMAEWLAKEKMMVQQLSEVNPKQATNYALNRLELLQSFFSVPANISHVFINL